ncbi:MAG: sensor of ECF-type sigma factor [Flavobacteriaceae bacterium]|nr:sensor of ECF-type sigma factor [Flavobacteriaceae bacterium]
MKHLLLSVFLLTLFISTKTYAQNDKQDKIKSLKIGFITQKLELTSKEAQSFWPVYNEHQDKIHGLRIENRKLRMCIRKNGGIDKMTNTRAETILNQLITIETTIKDEEIKMYESLKSILPAKKILKLYSAEQDFNRKILEQLKNRRENFRNRN